MNGETMFKKLRNVLGREYDPVEYWKNRENPNNQEGESSERVGYDVAYIRNQIEGCDSILEIGPGVGRTFGAYAGRKVVQTLDITEAYSKKIDKVAGGLGLEVIGSYLQATSDVFPYDDKQFDISVCSQVFLHVDPVSVEHYISEALRVSGKLVVICGGYKLCGEPPSHVFSHDFWELVEKMNLHMDNVKGRNGIAYFTLTHWN